MDVRNLIRYNHVVQELCFEALAKLPWSEVVKLRGASFDCMRNIFLHSTIVEDIWFNYITPGRFKDWTNTPFDEFKDFDELKKNRRHVKETTEASLNRLTPQELDRSIILPWGNPAATRMSIEAALAHIAIEDLIHYGELSDLLWQGDAQLPYLGFCLYIHNITSQDKTSK